MESEFETSRQMRIFLTIGVMLILTASCQHKFNSEKWKTKEDLQTFPYREAMLSDIIENNKFIGLPFRQVLDSLGKPSGVENKQLYYSIKTDYGRDVDPIYSKKLVLTIDKDSVVTEIEIKEWKK